MKVSSIQAQLSSQNSIYNLDDKSRKKSHAQTGNLGKIAPKSPTFGALGSSVLSLSGSLMQWIESKGYLVSFLIQDGLGMTTPRVWTGFHRDKDITGEYNFQEGFEVLGREGLTGPFIIGVAPAMFALTTKFCKSTNTNTRLIKRLSENFKAMIESKHFDKTIKKDAEKFKKEFYKYNLTQIYKDSVPNDTNSEESIKYILSEFEKYISNDKKTSKEAKNNLVNIFNEKMLETSSDLYSVNKLQVGKGKTLASFDSGEVLRAIKDFGDDAIGNNPDAKNIDTKAIENIKNNFAAKRLITNISNIIVTLAGLSIIPKLYARSDVAPGAKTIEQIQNHHTHKNVKTNDEANQKELSFKGKGINNTGFFEKIGKFITQKFPEKLHDLLEYTGYNFSRTTFALLSIFGMIGPRGKRAWDRAEVDERGKRDMTEINEILLRDTTSALSVVFAVPMMTKMMVKTYEDKKGFILSNRASDGKHPIKKFIDIINPYSKLEVLSVADLDAIYGNIDTKAKLLNFANFVDKKGGDLAKILAKSENVSIMFNDKTFTLESLAKNTRDEKNKKIINLFKNLSVKDINSKDEVISKLMKGSSDIKHNNIARIARGLNSLPGALSTLVLSPILLGLFIPMLTYRNTRKSNAKKIEEAQKKAAEYDAV